MEKLLGEKRRYKLYKAKSKWVVSAIITISGVTFLVTSPVSNAQADTVTGKCKNRNYSGIKFECAE